MAPNVTPHDAEIEMAELEMEEHRILRELKEMDEKVNDSTLQKKRHSSRDEPKHALNSLLAECESEVREAKGYISSTGPPLRIARCKRGEGVPGHATYLSRPKGTGVDFTVPVTIKEYFDVVKHPIFLNGIRDKCAANKYNSPEEYVADMKQLSKNTAAFNKGPELAWVVQHAKLLLECAEEAVRRRNRQFNEIMSALGASGGGGSRRVAGKRKRSSSDANGSTSHPGIGTVIQVYWDHDRKWYQGVIRDKSGSEVQILYDNDSNPEWLDLNGEAKWRLPTVRSKRIENASKRKKGSSTPSVPTSRGASTISIPPNIATKDDLANLREDLLAAVDDSKQVMLNTLQASTVSIENKLNRSDALHRVLLAVSDMQETMEGRVDGIQKLLDDVTISVEKLARHVKGLESGPRPRSSARNEDDSEERRKNLDAQQEPEKSVGTAEEARKELDDAEKSSSEKDKSPMDVGRLDKEKGDIDETPSEKNSAGSPSPMDETEENAKEVRDGESREAKPRETVDEPALPKDGDTMKISDLSKEGSEPENNEEPRTTAEETEEMEQKSADEANDSTLKKGDDSSKEGESKDEVASNEDAVEEVEIHMEEEDKDKSEEAGQSSKAELKEELLKEKEVEVETGGVKEKDVNESTVLEDRERSETDEGMKKEMEEMKMNGMRGDLAKQDKETNVMEKETVGETEDTKSSVGQTSTVTRKRPKAAKDEDGEDSMSSSSESSSESSSSSSEDEEDEEEREEKKKSGGVMDMEVDSSSSQPRKSQDRAPKGNEDDK